MIDHLYHPYSMLLASHIEASTSQRIRVVSMASNPRRSAAGPAEDTPMSRRRTFIQKSVVDTDVADFLSCSSQARTRGVTHEASATTVARCHARTEREKESERERVGD